MDISTKIQTQYISIESIPEFAAARAEARIEAESLMHRRQRQIESQDYERLPLAIDALSTADRVHDQKETFGEESAEYHERFEGLVMDCRRLVAEWRRKNKYEIFAPIVHKQDSHSDEYIANDMSVGQMTLDALVPTSKPEEDERRVNERVEEVTAMRVRDIGSLALGKTVRMRTVSECTDWAIDAYKEDGKSHGGYVPEIEKLMARDMTIDVKTGERIEEQVGLPGTYFTHDIIQRALLRRDFNADNLDKTALHGTQLLASDTLLEFVALLDEVASEEWCVEIFMGEVVPEGTVKDYEAARQEALERQADLEKDAYMVADFVMNLRDTGTDRHKAPDIVEEFVKNLLVNKAKDNISITTEMFDERTATGLQDVLRLQSRGQENDALLRLEQVIKEAPGGGYCGAGSCDLVSATNATEKERESLDELGFKPENTLIDKGDRRCKNCSAKTVAYDLKKKQKGCLNCKETIKY